MQVLSLVVSKNGKNIFIFSNPQEYIQSTSYIFSELPPKKILLFFSISFSLEKNKRGDTNHPKILHSNYYKKKHTHTHPPKSPSLFLFSGAGGGGFHFYYFSNLKVLTNENLFFFLEGGGAVPKVFCSIAVWKNPFLFPFHIYLSIY